MSHRPSRVLVTGAGGFIGSHLVDHLVETGDEVTALVHYRGENAEGHCRRDVRIVRGDVTDTDQMRRAVAGHDIVYHLAALGGPTYSFEAPAQYERVNVGGTVAVLEAVRAVDCRMVMMSTSEVYGDAQTIPMSEGHPVCPHSPYGASKAAAELFCDTFARSFGLDIRIARCFNVYGPRQSPRAVIPNMLIQALSGQTTLRVADPSIVRDYNFVRDTVSALRMIGTARLVGRLVNVASGVSHSLEDVGRVIGIVLGKTVEVEADPTYQRPVGGEVRHLHGDASAIRTLLGWEPSVSFVDGVRETFLWLETLPQLPPLGRTS